jgi:hypothetical protein
MEYHRLVLAYMCAFQGANTRMIQDECISMLTLKQAERAFKEAWQRHLDGEVADEFELT